MKLKPKDVDWSVKSFYVLPTYTCPFCDAKIPESGWIVMTKDGKKILVCFGCGETNGKQSKKEKKRASES